MQTQNRQFDHLLIGSPSGALTEPDRLDRGIEALHRYNLPIIEQAQARQRHQRFAGTDSQRLAALDMAFALSQSGLIVCTRGGYGLTRLLPQAPWVDWASRLNRYEHLLCGHSDITALQLALLNAGASPSGLLHGPMVCFDFGAPEGPHGTTLHHFELAAFANQVDVVWGFADSAGFGRLGLGSSPAVYEGPVWGGNLSVLSSMVGTPHLPIVDGGLLILEDINEPWYKVERMLLQLGQAGVLAKQQALILGDWGQSKPNLQDQGFDLCAIVEFIHQAYGLPVLTQFPFGHCTPKCCWFQGGVGQLVVQTMLDPSGGSSDEVLSAQLTQAL